MLRRGLAQSHSSKLQILQGIFDVLIIVLCFLLSAMLLDFPWNPHFSFFSVLAVVVFYIIARQSGLYRSWRTS